MIRKYKYFILTEGWKFLDFSIHRTNKWETDKIYFYVHVKTSKSKKKLESIFGGLTRWIDEKIIEAYNKFLDGDRSIIHAEESGFKWEVYMILDIDTLDMKTIFYGKDINNKKSVKKHNID